MDRAGVAGGYVAELPGPGVEDSVDHCGELLDRRVEGEQPIEAVSDLRRWADFERLPDDSAPTEYR